MNPWILLGFLLALIAAYWLGDHNGSVRATDHAIAQKAVNQDKTAAETNRRDEASAQARTTILDYLASIPKTEARSNDAAERVRVIYRDTPAKCVPDRPDGVQAELEQARAAANAAASGV